MLLQDFANKYFKNGQKAILGKIDRKPLSCLADFVYLGGGVFG